MGMWISNHNVLILDKKARTIWHRQGEDRNHENTYTYCHRATNRTDPQWWLSATLDVPLQYGRIPYLNISLISWAIHRSDLRHLLYYIAVWLVPHWVCPYRNYHDLSFGSRLSRSPLHTTQNEPKTAPRQLILVEIWRSQCLHMDFINYS